MILIVDHIAHVSESFDRTVPRSSGYSFSFGQIDKINDRVIVGWERLRLASIDNVEEINVVIPRANLN
jgi:hypothetical protein